MVKNRKKWGGETKTERKKWSDKLKKMRKREQIASRWLVDLSLNVSVITMSVNRFMQNKKTF